MGDVVVAGVWSQHADVLRVAGRRRRHGLGEVPRRAVQSLWRRHGDVHRPSLQPRSGIL